MSGFGRWLAAGREARNISQVELARLLKADAQSVSRWERGEVRPTRNTLSRIAEFFGEKPEALIDAVFRGGKMPPLPASAGDPAFAMSFFAQRRLRELSAEAGVEPGEWVMKFLDFLEDQTPDFQAFLRGAVAARVKRARPNHITGVVETETGLRHVAVPDNSAAGH